MAGEITTALTELKKRQAELATNLTAMGQHTDVSEPLDVQIPKVLNIETGGVTIAESDINFYDYDGTLIASWTLAQAQTATELPSAPSHTGLVFQAWTETLEYINALTMPLDVGAMYITESGASEFDHTFTAVTGTDLTIRIYNVSGTLTVDWGDGTIETSGAIGLNILSHSYADTGNYTNSIDSTGSYYLYGTSSTPYNIFNVTPNYTCTASRLGDRCTSIGSYAFYNCHSLTSITIPSSVTGIGIYAFNFCYSLTSVTIPSRVTSISSYAVYSCYSLTNITIPSSVTSIGSYAFRYCYSLTSITIPSSVTSIGSYAFNSCYSIIEYVMLSRTPPSLSGITAFTGINGICKIRVPAGSLTAWQTATNWISFADYMVEEEAA